MKKNRWPIKNVQLNWLSVFYVPLNHVKNIIPTKIDSEIMQTYTNERKSIKQHLHPVPRIWHKKKICSKDTMSDDPFYKFYISTKWYNMPIDSVKHIHPFRHLAIRPSFSYSAGKAESHPPANILSYNIYPKYIHINLYSLLEFQTNHTKLHNHINGLCFRNTSQNNLIYVWSLQLNTQ